MQAVQSGIGPRGPFTLDLHGLSKPAARLALQMVKHLACLLMELLCDKLVTVMHAPALQC